MHMVRTLRTVGIVGGTLALLLSASAALAEERPVTAKVNVVEKAATVKQRATALASTTQEKIKETQEIARERVQAVREEAKDRVAEKREKAQQRLADIQDKAKQQLAQKLTKQFDNLNTKWTDHFMQVLDHYDAVVEKIQNRTDTAASAGKEIATVTAAIQSAHTAIEGARAAVTAQAAKTYTLDTSTITATVATTTSSGQEKLMKNLRTGFQNLHKTLFKDLFALRDGPMKNVRTAVQSALQALKQIPGVDKNMATSTVERSDDNS